MCSEKAGIISPNICCWHAKRNRRGHGKGALCDAEIGLFTCGMCKSLFYNIHGKNGRQTVSSTGNTQFLYKGMASSMSMWISPPPPHTHTHADLTDVACAQQCAPPCCHFPMGLPLLQVKFLNLFLSLSATLLQQA